MKTVALIVTKKEQETLVSACIKIKEEIYLSETISEKQIYSLVVRHVPYTFIDTVAEDLQASTREDVIEHIDLMIKELFALPQAEAVLSFEPKLGLIIKIQQTASQLIGKHCVLKISVNTRLLGGLQLFCNNKLYDFSLATTLEKRSLQTDQ